MSEWIECINKMPPKNGDKFLFKHDFGIGLGEFGKTYKICNGNSEYDFDKYILILWPSEILNGECPFIWDDMKMIEMEVNWMELPK